MAGSFGSFDSIGFSSVYIRIVLVIMWLPALKEVSNSLTEGYGSEREAPGRRWDAYNISMGIPFPV